eukprot:TRINITY_DN29195_c2_g1_i1.p1 TRINITY_DN29195_c2_g1~~TRINITY_DN29195_c2_g1_i1.p1  ORF type:complete len:126 (-),score=2.56 TRINITY_DN29195_c2_g1_i1:311-688(-)
MGCDTIMDLEFHFFSFYLSKWALHLLLLYIIILSIVFFLDNSSSLTYFLPVFGCSFLSSKFFFRFFFFFSSFYQSFFSFLFFSFFFVIDGVHFTSRSTIYHLRIQTPQVVSISKPDLHQFGKYRI